MAFYTVDIRYRVIQRVPGRAAAVDNKRFFLIEAASAKQAWAKANRASGAIAAGRCRSCRHDLCTACEECSATKNCSDYWICHDCGELNAHVPKLEPCPMNLESVKLRPRRGIRPRSAKNSRPAVDISRRAM